MRIEQDSYEAGEVSVLARQEPWANEIGVMFIRRPTRQHSLVTGKEVLRCTWEPRGERDGTALEPTISMPKELAQRLMDELWQCGLRPSEGTGSAGAMAATQRHLEDMRTLVFKPGQKP